MDWLGTLKTLAPTVATALGGPLAGAAITALGGILNLSNPTQEKISKIFQDGQLTAEHLAQIRTLELQYQNDEKERAFKYSELQFQDTASARNMQMVTKSVTPSVLTWIVVVSFIGIEGAMLLGVKPSVSDIVLGRILGTLDMSLAMVLGFWFGSSDSSHNKDFLISNSTPNK